MDSNNPLVKYPKFYELVRQQGIELKSFYQEDYATKNFNNYRYQSNNFSSLYYSPLVRTFNWEITPEIKNDDDLWE